MEGLDLLIDKEGLFMNFLRHFASMPDILLFLFLVILLDLHMVKVLPLGFVFRDIPGDVGPGRVGEHGRDIDCAFGHCFYMIWGKLQEIILLL